MPNEKVIAVIGATGAQGGGLVRAILADDRGEFAARAITRDPDSEKAKAVAEQGVEVVQADLDDEASLARAFEGAHGAYGVTNYWELFSPEKELAQAGNLARAAKTAGVRHMIWSTLEDTRRWVPLDDDRMPTLMGRYKVPHFDAKGEADDLFRDAGVPTTFLLASFYWDNFIHFGSGPKRGPDGRLALTFPLGREKMPGIAAGDIGKCALGILRKGDELVGRSVGIAGEHLSGDEMAAAMSRALGQEVVYNDVPPAVFAGFGFPGADDLANMFQFYRDFADDVRGARDVDVSRELNPELMDFEQWLSKYGDRIPLD